MFGRGNFCLQSIFCVKSFLFLGARRKYAYLHAAVYVGFCKPSDGKCLECEGKECPGHHYVVENGGWYHKNEEEEQVGMVGVENLEKAFDKEARFYIFSPPRDKHNKSTRHVVLQRTGFKITLAA